MSRTERQREKKIFPERGALLVGSQCSLWAMMMRIKSTTFRYPAIVVNDDLGKPGDVRGRQPDENLDRSPSKKKILPNRQTVWLVVLRDRR